MPRRGRPRLYKTHTEKIRAYRQRKRARLNALPVPELPPLPPGPYRVVYADPPWRSFGLNPSFGGQVRSTYSYRPPWNLEMLCSLPVKARLMTTAVLLLWVPSPLLVESLSVVTAWGFRYRTTFVWDRMRPSAGTFHNGQHELLLVCTRGNLQPYGWSNSLSVQRIIATADEAKPDSFRQLIETHGPEGRRLELFARCEVPGWDVWPTDEEAEAHQRAWGEKGMVLEILAPERQGHEW